MTITRTFNGNTVNIELTPDELRQAYLEQEARYDREDIESYMEQYMDFHGDDTDCLTEEEYLGRVPEFARLYREALDDGSAYDWWDVAYGAIEQALENEKLTQNTRAAVD